MKPCQTLYIGFAFVKHETRHPSQWTQKYPKQHHGMQSSPHHGHNKRGKSLWGLMIGHKFNVTIQHLEDGGGLI